MTTRRRFTKEEDRLILSTVAKNPHNLSECFREVATKINRSPKCIANRWYHYLSKKDSNDKTNTIFVTVGKKSVNYNRKTAMENTQQPEKQRSGIWKTIFKLFFSKTK
jgi:hypothetical protein|nr:MAG TPA: MYB PROTO-ONCOGENE PROTEIN, TRANSCRIPTION REGULATION, MYB, C-MYB.58A [Crassvirales sp.]